MIDLIPQGSNWPEVVQLAKAVTAAGATLLNTGIGWHEARVPTIATSVPRAAFAWVTQKMRRELREAGIHIPLITSNRINMPEVAEQVLADGCADMVSLARPLLADPQFVNKAAQGRRDDINTCIACNQACLDHAFKNKLASCLVNPRAGHETSLRILAAPRRLKVAVVGAGPAGLAASTTLAERGHQVFLFDGAAQIGGQFNMAKQIPGKEEFHETLRYFGRRLPQTGVALHLNTRVDAPSLLAQQFDHIVIATGVRPRQPPIPGSDLPHVLSYIDVLMHHREVGPRVAIIGAGGIGFDVAEYLVTAPGHSPTADLQAWLVEWGVADPGTVRGGVQAAAPIAPARQVTLLQRKAGKLGAGLGKTTGWIHRAALQMKQVQMVGGVNYERITAEGLWVSDGEARSNDRLIACDNVVLCAGQEPLNELQAPLLAAGQSVFVIGGALEAGELDAKRAIDQGTRLGARL